VIRFTAQLQLWSGASASWHFIAVPDEFGGEIRAHTLGMRRGFGAVKVEVRIDHVTWRTSIFPMKAGGYFLPVKADVRRKAGIAPADDVTLEIDLL
jgi:hypothetical protein